MLARTIAELEAPSHALVLRSSGKWVCRVTIDGIAETAVKNTCP